MIHHDLRLVVMNPADHTLHCRRHGLLPDGEARDVFGRAGLDHVQVARLAYGQFAILARIMDVVVRLISRPRCVVDA